jgi:hypothetical protein
MNQLSLFRLQMKIGMKSKVYFSDHSCGLASKIWQKSGDTSYGSKENGFFSVLYFQSAVLSFSRDYSLRYPLWAFNSVSSLSFNLERRASEY